MTKRKTALLASVAVALVLGMGIAPAAAYFTDSSTTNGGLPISVEPSTDIHEWYKNGVKHVIISNDADADAPVFVRARVYASDVLDVSTAGSGWTDDIGGWHYYGASEDSLVALNPGDEASELTVSINFPKTTNPDGSLEGYEFGDNYNVIVVYESTPVLYQEDGTAYADWSFTLDNGVDSSNGEGGN